MTRKAYVLIQCSSGRVAEVTESLRGRPGITSADMVTGPCDVIATLEAPDPDAIAKLVLLDISGISGVTRTTTCGVVHLEVAAV